jgi:hypothetical protein
MKRYRSPKAAFADTFAANAIRLAIPMHSQAAERQNPKDDAAEYSTLSGATICLPQAVYRKFGGKAVSAALGTKQPNAAYTVELMTEKGSKPVAVDGATGEAAAAPEQQDNGGEDAECPPAERPRGNGPRRLLRVPSRGHHK